jgi:hypothetical protein
MTTEPGARGTSRLPKISVERLPSNMTLTRLNGGRCICYALSNISRIF